MVLGNVKAPEEIGEAGGVERQAGRQAGGQLEIFWRHCRYKIRRSSDRGQTVQLEMEKMLLENQPR